MTTIKAEEQRHLDWVEEKLAQANRRLQAQVKKTNAQERQVEADFGNNVRIKTDTYSGMMETALTVRQQQQLLKERMDNKHQQERQLKTVQRLQKKPYFARVDFTEKDGHSETIYIGLASFNDRADRYLIYDWRAPIASIYYAGGLGHVTYPTPEGNQEVDLTLKRQFIIEDGTLVTVYDTDETVGDQMLLQALDGRSSTKMKSIVSTIQRQQNEIIRDTNSELLFVQGAAGSGKTAAVLQRVAYLLYQYRGNLTAQQIILFSPNQLFNDYVNSVLPELGEQNMVQLTYYQYTQHRVPNMKVATLAQRFEATQDATSQNIARYMGSAQFFAATQAYAEYLGTRGLAFKPLKLDDKVLVTPEQIAQIYYSFNENYNLGNRLFATKEALIKRLNKLVNQEAKTDEAQKHVQELTRSELEDLYGDGPRNFADGQSELNFLSKQLLMRRYAVVQDAINHNLFVHWKQTLVNFWRDVPQLLPLSKFGVTPEQWRMTIKHKVAALNANQISGGDVTIYLYLYDLLTGRHGQSEIRHVFLDEVQDYSAYQLAYLKTTFPKAKFTMLGDLNQAIFTGNNASALMKELGRLFAPEKTRVVQLTKSYRSTKEITLFSRALLKHGAKVVPFDRPGAKPVVQTVATPAAAATAVVADLKQAAADHLTTAIITKTLAEAEQLHDALAAQNVATTVIATENQRLAQGTLIIPAYLAKGLEFDNVIAYGVSAQNFGDDSTRLLLYTICSRAMHRLLVLAVGQPSPLIGEVDATLYERK